MEYDILMFLCSDPNYNTAADIVKIRKSTKSHVSTSLKMLEDKHLIKKEASPGNKKHIEIILLDNAREIVSEGLDIQKKFAESLFKGLSEEEMTICSSVFIKICGNAEECLKNLKEMGE